MTDLLYVVIFFQTATFLTTLIFAVVVAFAHSPCSIVGGRRRVPLPSVFSSRVSSETSALVSRLSKRHAFAVRLPQPVLPFNAIVVPLLPFLALRLTLRPVSLSSFCLSWPPPAAHALGFSPRARSATEAPLASSLIADASSRPRLYQAARAPGDQDQSSLPA